VLHFLFGLHGRIPRAAFCLFAAIGFVVLLTLFAALYMYWTMSGDYEGGGPKPWPSSPEGIAGAALWLLILFFLIGSSLAVSLKRLHDRDKAWWWLFIFFVVPNALSSLGAYSRQSFVEDGAEVGALFDFASLALLAWAFVELACLKGTNGDNRFGHDPLVRLH
jgi:uncharacterized membrane protein YhaH (DUF805 family)